MKISIITPTYNSERTIAQTIESVVNQGYKDLEYIIIDGKSTDNTLSIIEEYKKTFPIKLISENDQGVYDAMNKGINLSSGEIISILNSDDLYDNNKILSEVQSAFNKDDKAEIVYGDIKYFANEPSHTTRYWKTGTYREKKLNNGWIIPHPALFIKKSVYHKYGTFNLDFKIAADYEFILRVLKTYKLKPIYLPLVCVKMYNQGSSAKNRLAGWKELKKAWKINNLQLPRFFIIRRILFKISQYIFKS